MAGMAGVTMVRSRAERRTERQRGVMVRAMVVPEGRLPLPVGSGVGAWGSDSGDSCSVDGGSLSGGSDWLLLLAMAVAIEICVLDAFAMVSVGVSSAVVFACGDMVRGAEAVNVGIVSPRLNGGIEWATTRREQAGRKERQTAGL